MGRRINNCFSTNAFEMSSFRAECDVVENHKVLSEVKPI